MCEPKPVPVARSAAGGFVTLLAISAGLVVAALASSATTVVGTLLMSALLIVGTLVTAHRVAQAIWPAARRTRPGQSPQRARPANVTAWVDSLPRAFPSDGLRVEPASADQPAIEQRQAIEPDRVWKREEWTA